MIPFPYLQTCSKLSNLNLIELPHVVPTFVPYEAQVLGKKYLTEMSSCRPGKSGKMRVHLENLETSWNLEKITEYPGKMT